ncbi:hypothetical protein K505DRAFT_330984 [Melanomma pulvis-pyrius CBS 109.77]|uniref:Uncharacterized protein n=1 Tax=Melanomma pulvis-pyrius CBS 109.77 TaxID=1314802 RepID=A0A6A6WNF3_9PLEO|nr:hypothetical protein K505DRAFT_330984 [Melanomma pulvis-pyrius CBS 109.77]
MVDRSSPKPIYHDPGSDGHSRPSRSSSRRSRATSLAFPSSPNPRIESPRTLCPRDGDAFSYNPTHLSAWYISQDLWDRLTPQLQSTLASMQHSGAAVLTGYERLEQHTESLDGGRPDRKMDEDEFLVQLDNSLPSMPLKLRTTSNASSMFSAVASPVFTASPISTSGSTTPPLSSSQVTSPISPICLTPADANVPSKRDRSRDRSFSTPLEPHNAYYATELSHLRTESIPRLRHAARSVDKEWYEAKRSGAVSINDVIDFEAWWANNKSTIRTLDEKCQRLSAAVGIASTGMGWTAP